MIILYTVILMIICVMFYIVVIVWTQCKKLIQLAIKIQIKYINIFRIFLLIIDLIIFIIIIIIRFIRTILCPKMKNIDRCTAARLLQG